MVFRAILRLLSCCPLFCDVSLDFVRVLGVVVHRGFTLDVSVRAIRITTR